MLAPLVEQARGDPETLGLILSGSRGDDCGDEESDYDLIWVLTDEGFERRKAGGVPLRQDSDVVGGRYLLSIRSTSPSRLAELAAKPSWRTYGYVASKVLLDKTGAVAEALRVIATMPEEQARLDAAAWFDAYLNAFYRAMKASRRGNELGARLQAANSVEYLVKALFSLDRRRPPYHDRLERHLSDLDDQGWSPGYLRDTFVAILRTANPKRQQELEVRVEALMRDRGFGKVLDDWGLDIEWVKAFRFEERRLS